MDELYCIHGNLQRAEVWDSLKHHLSCAMPELSVSCVDLWQQIEPNCIAWAEHFCQKMKGSVQTCRRRYVLGYSLGGRLAMHAVVQCPNLWDGAIFVAADPGTDDLKQRRTQQQRDEMWARRFLSEDWTMLMREWNAQAVFGGRANGYERASEISRNAVAASFRNYSKGQQLALCNALAKLSIPMVYVVGEEDTKYCALAQSLEHACTSLSVYMVRDACHRVPWEQPAYFHTLVETFLCAT